MPRGQPDFGMYAVKTVGATLSDVGELAARLGSINTFDRRGDVVWFDDFEGDINGWFPFYDGDGAGVEASAERARSGAFSCKLTTGDEVGDPAMAVHYAPYPVVGGVGFEISFTIAPIIAVGELHYHTFILTLFDGTHRHYAMIRYVEADKELLYWDGNPDWKVLASDLKLYFSTYEFKTLKLVIDLKTHKYMRLILNAKEYDMKDLSYQLTDDPITTPYWGSAFRLDTGRAENTISWIDDVILTQNEL